MALCTICLCSCCTMGARQRPAELVLPSHSGAVPGGGCVPGLQSGEKSTGVCLWRAQLWEE